MKKGVVMVRGTAWFVSAVAAAIACSSGNDAGTPGANCGEGTVLKDGKCVVAGSSTSGGSTIGGSAANQGGEANSAGKTSAGGDSDVGTAGAAVEGGAGSLGGATGDDGGVAGEPGATGDAGADGEGGAGGSEPVPTVLPTRWLAFSHQKGVFAYDSTKFPAADALVTLSDQLQNPIPQAVRWSPDGRSLLYADGVAVNVADMTGDTPGAPRLVLSGPGLPTIGVDGQRWAWSADSASIAVLAQTTLSVFDPSVAAPTLHQITTTTKLYRWAPAGNWLLYFDASGNHAVKVSQGVPGTPLQIDAYAKYWSPNGTQIASLLQNGDVALTTLGSSASFETLTDLGGTSAAVTVSFNRDGSKLAFSTESDTDTPNGFIIDLKPAPSQPKPVVSNAPDGAHIYCDNFSPDGTRLVCRWLTQAADGVFAADANGGQAISVLDHEPGGAWVWSPKPALHQLFTIDYVGSPKLVMVDLTQPNTATPLYNGTSAYSVSPAGNLLSYIVKPTVHVLNLAAPADAPADIQTSQLAFDPPIASWSPDGRFIAVADGAYQERLVRIDGAALSTPVPLQVTSKYRIVDAWQP